MAVHIEEKTPSSLNLRSYDFFPSNLLVIIVGKKELKELRQHKTILLILVDTKLAA